MIKVKKRIDWDKVKRQKERREKTNRRKLKLINFKRKLFFEYVDKGDNGVFGPGYHNYGYYKLSWGKLSFVALVVLILIILL